MTPLMCGALKNNANESIYKTEVDSQKTDLQLPKEKGGRDKLRVWT